MCLCACVVLSFSVLRLLLACLPTSNHPCSPSDTWLSLPRTPSRIVESCSTLSMVPVAWLTTGHICADPAPLFLNSRTHATHTRGNRTQGFLHPDGSCYPQHCRENSDPLCCSFGGLGWMSFRGHGGCRAGVLNLVFPDSSLFGSTTLQLNPSSPPSASKEGSPAHQDQQAVIKLNSFTPSPIRFAVSVFPIRSFFF